MLRRSGPRSPTRCACPTNSSRFRGRIRAASGCRSGGGWKRASGRAPVVRRADGMRAMVAPALERRQPREVRDDPEREQDQDERAADDRDPPDVPSHVGVFLGRGDVEARRPARSVRRCERSACARSRLRPASPRRRWPPRAPPRGPPPRRSACRVARAGAVTATGWVAGRVDAAGAGGVGAVPVGTCCLGLAWPWSVEGLHRGSGSGRGRGRARAAGRAADGRG